MALTIRELSRRGPILVIGIGGSLDGRTVERFTAELDRLVTGEIRHVVVDCSGVAMISSPGLGALLSLQKRLEAREGEVCLTAAQGVPAMILYMTRLDRVFRQFADVASATGELERASRD